jgi:membrane protease YdiL (CAAX protease family)
LTLPDNRWRDAATVLSPPPAQLPGDKLRALLLSIAFSSIAILVVYLLFGIVLAFGSGWLAYALAIIALLLESWLFLAVGEGKTFDSLGLSFHRGWLQMLLSGAAVGATLMAVVCGTLAATHLARYSGLAHHAAADYRPLAAIALFILLAASLEEIAFRGYAFQRLVDAAGAPSAIAIFSLLFGLGHYSNPSATALSIANTILAGMVMALGFLRTRSLWFPIGLHFAWNFVLGPIASFPVSGIRFKFSMFEVHVSGPIWLTGGDYGPEGGIVLTAACLLAIAWMLRAPRIALPGKPLTPYDRASGT